MKKIKQVQYNGENQLAAVLSMPADVEPVEAAIFELPPDFESSSLDRIMGQIQREGRLKDVVNVIQKVEKILDEYRRDSVLYKIFFPAPYLLVKKIKEEFAANQATKPLFENLYISWKLKLSNIVYVISLVLAVFSLLAVLATILSPSYYPLLFFILLLIIALIIQVNVFEDTIKNIAFTQIHNTICAVFEKAYQNYINFVSKTLELAQQVEERKLEIRYEAEEEKYRLEAEISLSDLAATVAINQATTESEVQKIKDNTTLEYRQKELGIIDEIDERKRRHQIALSAIESMGRALVEQAKVLAVDDAKKREIEYQLHLLNGMKNKFQTNGNAGFSDEAVGESVQEMMKRQMKPKNTRRKDND
jgi:hypothetical protein